MYIDIAEIRREEILKGKYTRSELGVKRGNIQWKVKVNNETLLFVNDHRSKKRIYRTDRKDHVCRWIWQYHHPEGKRHRRVCAPPCGCGKGSPYSS